MVNADSKILRYGLYWAQLDPTRGSEIAKTRPVVVISPDEMNRHLETVVVCPLNSQLHPHWASRVQCQCDGVTREIAVDQIRTVTKSRLIPICIRKENKARSRRQCCSTARPSNAVIVFNANWNQAAAGPDQRVNSAGVAAGGSFALCQ